MSLSSLKHLRGLLAAEIVRLRFRKNLIVLASSKQILYSEQNIHICSQRQRTSIADDWQLDAALNNKPGLGGVLKSGREVILCCVATGYRRAVQTPVTAMNKSGFQNEKQFVAGSFIFAWEQDVLEIRVQPLLMAHAKTVSFTAEDSFCVANEDEPPTSVGERQI